MMWTATDPDSRRLSSYRRTSADDYIARIEALLATGEGYTAVHHAGQQYPLLTLSFKDGYGVIHQFPTEDRVLLLVGDGVVGARETVSVPVLDDVDYAVFTGEYVLSCGRAWTAVQDFLLHGAVGDLGEWQELLTAAPQVFCFVLNRIRGHPLRDRSQPILAMGSATQRAH